MALAFGQKQLEHFLELFPFHAKAPAINAPVRPGAAGYSYVEVLSMRYKSVNFRAKKYKGTSLIRNSAPLGPYSGTMPRALWWSWGGWLLLISEVPLYPP